MSELPIKNEVRQPFLTITERVVGKTIILDLNGHITVSKGGLYTLQDKINSLIEAKKTNLILNMENVPFIDSHAIGALVGILTKITNRNGKLILLNPGNRTLDLLEISNLKPVFTIYSNEQEAVSSFD